MDQVFIRIPLNRVIAGDYKVGLSPRLDKTAVSLPELVQQTNAFSVKNRPGCTPVLKNSNPKDLFLSYNVKCHLPDSDPSGHDVRVHFDVDKVQETGKAKNLDVQVSCSCPAFLYWGAQWNLHQRDGLEGEPRPALQAPKERLDLRSNFVICKHCKSVFERILPAVQHNMDNIIRDIDVKRHEKEIEEKGTPSPSIRRQLAPKDKDIDQKLRDGLEKREREKLLKDQGIVKRDEEAEPEGMVLEPIEKAEERTKPPVEEDLSRDTDAEQEQLERDRREEKKFLEWQEKQERGKLLRERNNQRLETKNTPKKPTQIEPHPDGPHEHTGLPYKRTPVKPLITKNPKKKSSLLTRDYAFNRD